MIFLYHNCLHLILSIHVHLMRKSWCWKVFWWPNRLGIGVGSQPWRYETTFLPFGCHFLGQDRNFDICPFRVWICTQSKAENNKTKLYRLVSIVQRTMFLVKKILYTSSQNRSGIKHPEMHNKVAPNCVNWPEIMLFRWGGGSMDNRTDRRTLIRRTICFSLKQIPAKCDSF